LEEGDFASADLEIAAFDRLARRTRQPGHLWYPPLWRGMRGLLAGREADAEAYADEVEGIGRQAQSSNAYILATTLRFAARWGRPDGLAELLPALEEYGADVPPDYPPLLVTAASVWASIGDKDRAMRSYRPLAEQSFASIPEDAEFLSCLLGCTEAAVLLGDRVGAEALHALLTPHASRWIVDGIGAACWGVGAEWLARLEDLLGRRVDADRHRGEAAQAYQAAGAVGPLRRLTGAGAQPAGRHGELRHGAGGWVVTWAGEQTVLPDLKGMHDLATLVVRPGTPVPALTLLAGAAGVAIVPAGGSDEILDEQARSAYRDRLRALEDEIADATARGDLGRAEHHRDERDFLVRELSAALGLGGRPRRLGDESDRARKAVTMRLREVIMRLDGPMPALARHLRAAMRTGRECCYDPEEPVSWWVGSLPRPGDRWTG
ncbi:MAG: hypothetical protein H0U35_03550, partial [Sporichthyaceae bacterium]|nr:hypothetical protein [Sporichthyaceae bacterium]